MSVTITVETVVLIFVIILIIAACTAWYCNPDSHDKSRWYIFIITLASLSIILTFFFYYSLVEIQDQQHQLDVIEQTQTLTKNITSITSTSMIRAAKIIPNFIRSLNPIDFDDDDSNNLTSNKSNNITNSNNSKLVKESYEKTITTHALSNEIFSIWQETIFYRNFTKVKEERSYTLIFLQWANSIYLYKEWCKHKLLYSHETIIFGDLLFKYSLRIKDNHNTSSYVKAYNRLLDDDDYIYLFC